MGTPDFSCPSLTAAPYEFYPPNELLSQPAYQDLAERRRRFGLAFAGPLGIAREEKEKRRRTTERNWDFFNAPIAVLVTTPDISPTGAYLDCGFFVMSLLLAARARGLEACVQVRRFRFDCALSCPEPEPFS